MTTEGFVYETITPGLTLSPSSAAEASLPWLWLSGAMGATERLVCGMRHARTGPFDLVPTQPRSCHVSVGSKKMEYVDQQSLRSLE